MQNFIAAPDDEIRLRSLANELAKGIEEPRELLKRLGFSAGDYEELCETRTFKAILDQAVSEWSGASNTHKRVRLKASVNIEQALPDMYLAMTDHAEPLSSRVKAFEIMARIANLGNPDPVAQGTGSSFQLTIHLDNQKMPIVINSDPVEASYSESSYSQSKLFDDLPLEDL